MEVIRVIMQRPMNIPRVMRIRNELKKFQEVCDEGYIESIHIPTITENGITCYVNEDGKRLMLTPNFAIVVDGKVHDMVVGTALFVRHDDDGNAISLTDEDIKTIVVGLKLMELMR
jgi:glutaredoxin-related protein